MKIKVLLAIIAVLFVSVLFLIYRDFYPVEPKLEVRFTPQTITPTVSQTNWKTYENKDYGFSFQCDPTFFKYSSLKSPSFYLATSAGSGEAIGTPLGLTQDGVWFSINIYPSESGEKNEYKKEIIEKFPQEVASYQVKLTNNQKVYEITMSSFSKKTLEKSEAVFDQILSTFKFTK